MVQIKNLFTDGAAEATERHSNEQVGIQNSPELFKGHYPHPNTVSARVKSLFSRVPKCPG